MKLPRLLVLGLLSLLVGACATPQDQRLQLTPAAPELEAGDYSGRVAFEVVDRREAQELGLIEVVEGEAGRVPAGPDLAYAVQLAAARGLSEAGFRATLWSDDAEPRLLIEIEELRHTVSAQLPREVRTEVQLAARAWRDGRRYSTRAQSTVTDHVALRPSAADNAKIVEQAITEALERLLAPKLTDFLAHGRN